jgi:hypothetical protein
MRSPRSSGHRHQSLRFARIAFGAACLVAGALGFGHAPAQTPPGADPATAPPAATQTSAADSAATRTPERVEVRGVVHDANGGPVRGASIRVMSETDTVDVQSNGDGRFLARVTATRGVRVLVQAFGYRDLVRSFRAAGRPVIQAALALPPPYPLAGVTITSVRLPRRVDEIFVAGLVASV